MSKLIIFDKDGTLVEPLSGTRFTQHPRDQKILPGVLEAVKNYKQQGYKLTIASNQGGVHAHFKTLDSAIEEMGYCLQLFPEIELGVFCPDSGHTLIEVQSIHGKTLYSKIRRTKDGQLFRKPGAGMLDYLLRKYQAERSQSWMFGDLPEDEGAAVSAGIQFMDADIVRQRFLMPNEQQAEQGKYSVNY